MKAITNAQIEEWFKNNFSQHVEYDGLKIERFEKYGRKYADVKVISFGRKVGWFEGCLDEDFFQSAFTHFKWQFNVNNPSPIKKHCSMEQNEQQIIDALMRPRFEVIADYPRSHYKVGQVIDFEGMLDWEIIEADTYCKLYPCIFKPLPWYSHRSVEEMPEYVKIVNGDGGVVRVAKAEFDHEATSKWWMFLDGEIHPYDPNDFIPATSAEYNAFINSKQ
jgi:hypothetical protein